jgi:hypothetical protein
LIEFQSTRPALAEEDFKAQEEALKNLDDLEIIRAAVNENI